MKRKTTEELRDMGWKSVTREMIWPMDLHVWQQKGECKRVTSNRLTGSLVVASDKLIKVV